MFNDTSWHLRNTTLRRVIKDHFGKNYFKGKKLLSVGCGHGHIGSFFHLDGAQIFCSDSRVEYLGIINKNYPFIKTIQSDLDDGWKFADIYDVVLILGVLYHLVQPDIVLNNILHSSCKADIILETEIVDSFDPNITICLEEEGKYQSSNGLGCRPSYGMIHEILKKSKRSFTELKNKKYNTLQFNYTNKITDTGVIDPHTFRRIWFIDKL